MLNKLLKMSSLIPECLLLKSALSRLMRTIKSLLAIPVVVGSMTLMVPPSQSQGVTDMLKAQVPLNKLVEKAKRAGEKAAREAAKKAEREAAKEKLRLEPVVGGCAGTREGCNPEKKIKQIFNKKMKKCVKAPCPAW